jgi:hypothetical protein
MEAFSPGMRLTPSHAIKQRPTVSLPCLRRANHRGRNRSRTKHADRCPGARHTTRVVVQRRRRALSSRPLIRLGIAASSNADVLEPDGDRLAVRNYFYPYARVIAGPLRLVCGRVSSQVRTRRAGGASAFRTVRPPREQSGPILAEQERSQRRRLEVLIRRATTPWLRRTT